MQKKEQNQIEKFFPSVFLPVGEQKAGTSKRCSSEYRLTHTQTDSHTGLKSSLNSYTHARQVRIVSLAETQT